MVGSGSRVASDLAVTEQAILVVDDEPASLDLLDVTLGKHYKVYTATDGRSAHELLAAHPDIALAIVDQRMPGMDGTEFIRRAIEPYPNLLCIIVTGFTDTESLIEAINAGLVYRYLTKPWNKDELLGVVRQGLEVHRFASENQRLQEELRAANERWRFESAVLKREAKGRYCFEEIVGTSPALQRMLDRVEPVIATDTNVLISGETGTGKELFARAIHYNGPRADKPFLTVNCAAFAPELLASELFGHKMRGFPGAHEDRQGLFKAADGGTLFLDEIGHCSPELQVLVLRVLDREIRRLGEHKPIMVDVQFIAATNKDLQEEVAAGRFRLDLFLRLSVFTIHLPPLRERKEDVPLLVDHFLQRLARKHRKAVHGFTAEALALFTSYDFPGNVRELENEVERVFTLAEPDSYVTPGLLSPKFGAVSPEPTNANAQFYEAVGRYEAQLIREALARNNGSPVEAAKDLGIARETLFAKMKKYRIDKG